MATFTPQAFLPPPVDCSVRCCPRSRQRPSSFSPPLPSSTVVARNHVGYRGRHVDSVPFNSLFGAPFIPPPPPPRPLRSLFTFLSFLPFSSLLGFAWKCVIFVFTSLSFFRSSTYLFQVYSGLRGSVFTFLSFFLFSSYLFQVCL